MKKTIGLMVVLAICVVFTLPATTLAADGRTIPATTLAADGRTTLFTDDFSKGVSDFDIDINAGFTDLAIKVINGPGGAKRVSSASVTINGVEILSNDDFNQTVGNLGKPLELPVGTTNIIVKVNGNKSAEMTIKITGVPFGRTNPGPIFPGAR